MTRAFTIDEVVPHSGLMSLLDSVVEYDELSLTAAVSIHRNSLFAEQRGVPAWVGIEYMAQAIAAYAGVQARLVEEDVKIGFLVGTRRYQSNTAYFATDTELLVSVQQQLRADNGLGSFQCRLYDQEETIEATASLNVFQPNDVQQYLDEHSART